MNGGPTEVDRVRSLREVLTATGAGVYLCTHMAGPIPAETIAAVHESDDMELRVGRAGLDREDDLVQREKEARAVVAAAVKASPERMVLAHGAAEAAAAVTAQILSARARAAPEEATRLIVLEGVADTVLAAVRAVAEAAGVDVEQLDQAPQIMAADVALVVMAHVDAHGAIGDVSKTADAAHKAGARLLVDASLSVGAITVEVADLGADIVIADTHRWLLGPEAVAFAWLAPELGGDVPTNMQAMTGPFGRAALLALARSLGWLLMYVELPWLLARTDALSERLYAALGAIDGVEVMAQGPRHGALASFRIRDWDALQAAEELGRSVFAILDADIERDVVRASVGAWNREDELDRFIERVAELASHTPATLPRKPSLTVISGPVLLDDDA